MPFFILPDPSESTPICPCHYTVAITSPSLEAPLVLCLFNFTGLLVMTRWQTIVILHASLTIGSSVFEASKESISILVGHLGLPVQTSIEERASFAALVSIG